MMFIPFIFMNCYCLAWNVLALRRMGFLL